MRSTRITIPELVLFGATRGMIGTGLGLLVAGRLERDRRFAVGWTLIAVGALSTIPLAMEVFGRGHRMHDSTESMDGLNGVNRPLPQTQRIAD